jgi:hypothetical protein
VSARTLYVDMRRETYETPLTICRWAASASLSHELKTPCRGHRRTVASRGKSGVHALRQGQLPRGTSVSLS